jgi:hypothetical protein
MHHVQTHSEAQWVPGALFLRVKRPEREAYHSPASSSKVKNAWSYNYTPPLRLHGTVLNWSTGTTLPYLYVSKTYFHIRQQDPLLSGAAVTPT